MCMQGPAGVTPARVWLAGYVNVSHEMGSSLNISPYGVLECDIIITELHAYDFEIEDFVIKKGIICAGPCIYI